MFSKILIANRGEIACRVIKTANQMGISTVAVYSDADAGALHTQMATEAVHIGPSSPTKSYLMMEKIIQACKETGAEAVHPGYGFLSESRAFAELLARENIIFIGPSAESITAMGDKITSKQIAARSGIQTIPGHDGVIKDSSHAIVVAENIGYPVMLKASAGGGGKGMRVAWDRAECQTGFDRASSEALSSFGDDRILIEKFIEDPRHIEIQIIADTHGNIVYLGERECSIQRRHQKIIEEAPSPFLSNETRKAMGEQAILLAKSVNYHSAGTVEFVVDAKQNFYFLEMNTRLQVEHPVTEMVTGLDLVELMIKVADGEKLPLSQNDITAKGWGLECRVYAEDPFSGFLPSVGRLKRYIQPDEKNGTVRVDSGVFEGGEISRFYDPMIAKLVTYGKNRSQAIAQMREALDEFVIQGIKHNIPLLGTLISHPSFMSGDFNTNFIDEQYPEGFNAQDVILDNPALPIVVAAIIHRLFMDRAAHISGQLQGHERRVHDNWVVVIGTVFHDVRVLPFQKDCGFLVEYDAKKYKVTTDWSFAQTLFHGTINGELLCFQVKRDGLQYQLFHQGSQTDAMVMTPMAAELLKVMLPKEVGCGSKCLQSPMPGLLLKISVKEGDQVKAGTELAIIEAMKMENVLKASHDTIINRIITKVGDSLDVDQIILEYTE